MTDEELIEQVARAIATADGLNYDEVCGVVADPDNGECDSGTCLAAWDEDHDFYLSRRHYQHRARAILPIIKAERIRGGEMVKEAAAETAKGYALGCAFAIRALSVPAIVEAGDGDL